MRSSRGFTYLGVMFVVAILAMTTAMASVLWSTEQRRDNERELLFAGRQMQAAIERYRQQSKPPGSLYPRTLEELLRDDRSIKPQRHLRRIPVDPMTGDRQWGLIRLPDGGIVGIYSLSERVPFPRKYVTADFESPPGRDYRAWRFVAPSAKGLIALAEATVAEGGDPLLPGPARAGAPRNPAAAGGAENAAESCDRLQAQDERACARLSADATLACRDSATARQIACSLGGSQSLPRLILRAP